MAHAAAGAAEETTSSAQVRCIRYASSVNWRSLRSAWSGAACRRGSALLSPGRGRRSLADASARQALARKPTVTFADLARIMVEADVAEVTSEVSTGVSPLCGELAYR